MAEITEETAAAYDSNIDELAEIKEVYTHCVECWDNAEMTKPEIIRYIENSCATHHQAVMCALATGAAMEHHNESSALIRELLKMKLGVK